MLEVMKKLNDAVEGSYIATEFIMKSTDKVRLSVLEVVGNHQSIRNMVYKSAISVSNGVVAELDTRGSYSMTIGYRGLAHRPIWFFDIKEDAVNFAKKWNTLEEV